jgi:hypothetical protein
MSGEVVVYLNVRGGCGVSYIITSPDIEIHHNLS